MNKKEIKELPKEMKKFSFWETFIYILFAILVLLLILFRFIGSYEVSDFSDAFIIGIAIFSGILAIPFTFFIKWWKEYKLTGRLITKEAEEKDINGKPQTKKNKLAIIGFVLGIASIFFGWIGIIPISALILSSIGLHQAKNRKEGDAILAIIGLILGAIYTLVYMRTYGHI